MVWYLLIFSERENGREVGQKGRRFRRNKDRDACMYATKILNNDLRACKPKLFRIHRISSRDAIVHDMGVKFTWGRAIAKTATKNTCSTK